MKRSSKLMVSAMGLLVVILAALRADEPAKNAVAIKPLRQHYLQGQDAKNAVQQEKKLAELQETGKFEEALKVAASLAELRKNVQGGDHWQTIDAQWQVEAIRRVLQQSAEMQKAYAGSLALMRQAEALHNKGADKDAQPLFEKVLDTRRKVLGEEHPHTASSYLLLALSQEDLGKASAAEENFRKALLIRRKVLGDEHTYTITCYSHLANILQNQGRYAQAEAEFRRVLALRRKTLGEQRFDTALCYGNLAGILSVQGKHREAEDCIHKELATIRKLLGDENAYTATSYTQLAIHLSAQGKRGEAEEWYRKALTINRAVLGEERIDTAISYNNLASNLHAQGKFKEAEKNLRQALAILTKAQGEEHPDTATCYNNLAFYLHSQHRYQEAEEFSRKSLAIARKMQGESHPNTALSYNTLAGNLYAQGRYQEAAESLRKALASFRLLGEEHPHTLGSYKNLALNLHAQGNYREAEALLVRATDSFAKARLQIAATGLGRATFTGENSPLSPLAAVLARNGKPDDAWKRFEESLARGVWDDLTSRLRRPQAERDKQTQLTDRISRLQKFIERVRGAKPNEEQTKQREELLAQLRQAYDELAAFTQQLEKDYGPIAGQIFSRGKIQESFPTDAALIGWLDIAGQPKAADPSGEHWAVLLRSAGDPIWVRLQGTGDKNAWTDADTQLPGRLRTALQSSTSKWQPLAERLHQQRLQPLAQHLKGLRHLIVLPSTALAGVPVEVIADGYTVSYAHSGTMYAHLRQQPTPTSKGLFALADPVFETAVVAVKPQPLPPRGILITRVLPGSKAFRAGLRANDVLLRYGETDLAGPADFKPLPEKPDSDKDIPVIVWRDGVTRKQPLYVRPGKLGVVIAKEPAPRALAEQHRLDRVLASRSGDDGKWNRLPGTRLEVAALQRLFGNELSWVLLDSEASEQRLDELAQSDALSKYRYIHLATHGEVNDKFPLRSAVMLSRDRLPNDKQRTDLLIAGQSIPDGRLSAEEVLGRWNLNADLVTLSACQTALGKYERGEGFVGFAQALVLSGSRSVCLSLWEVNDIATALLMERFYQNLLGKRDGLTKPMGKTAALAEAKRWLRNLSRSEMGKRAASLSNGLDRSKHAREPRPEAAVAPAPVAAAKSDRPYAHPYFWAAFVLVGDAD